MSQELLDRIESLESELKELRGERNKWRAEKADMEEVLGPALEAQRRELVRSKGFDSDSVEGKRLMKAMVDGEIEADGSNLVEVARDGFGYEPTNTRAHYPTDDEFVAQYNANKLSQLAAVTVSDTPPSDAEAIKEAEAAGEWDKARYLKASLLAEGTR